MELPLLAVGLPYVSYPRSESGGARAAAEGGFPGYGSGFI
jgi:hypothetical protein